MNKVKISLIGLIIPALILSACASSPTALQVIGEVPQAVVSNTSANSASTSQSSAVTNPSVAAASPVASQTNVDLAALQNAFESVYIKVNPSVVSIEVIEQATPSTGGRRNPFANSTPSTALGSGFVWDTQGHIVTNNHVVSGASSITVTFADGTTVDATVVGTDPNADLAVVKVDVAASELVPVSLADSSQVKVGELAIAIGNPFGLANTMTQGIISALSRTLPVGLDSQTTQTGPSYSIPDIIQTDAPINPGNSGGVLVDMNGELLGVTAAIESSSNSSSGIGFVIPTEIVKLVVPSLISTGAFDHAYLGITGVDMSPDIAKAMNLNTQQKGALIIDVTSGGPADKAGVQASTQPVTIAGQSATVGGDVITAINGQAVNEFADVGTYLLLHAKPGDTVTLTVLRQGKEVKVPVTVGTLPVQ
jgi:serine protease Do